MESSVLLEARGISKSFGPTKALKNVNVCVAKGEIRGLIGENGSGKSTFSSIAAGVLNRDMGEFILAGKPYDPIDAVDAGRNGISLVVQEQGTIGGLSVAANLFLGKESLFTVAGFLNVGSLFRETRRALESIGVNHIDPSVLIDGLTFEDKKMVELARAMYDSPTLLIIDETTTALAHSGRRILYETMRKVVSGGGSVLFISHDIDEIMSLCDSLTILRDGQLTANLVKAEFESRKIKHLMVGREVADNLYGSAENYMNAQFLDPGKSQIPGRSQDVALRVRNINVGILHDISLDIQKREILGIGGLTDCGMHELGQAIFGVHRNNNGLILLADGTPIVSPRSAIRNKLAYVPKDRDKDSLMLSGSILDNVCLPSHKILSRHGLITKKRERVFVEEWTEFLKVKMSSARQFCRALSGGNKQKVALAKWMGTEADIYILDCPTRGIDVGVKVSIYKLMRELKSQGKAIIMISEELPELIGMSDRLIIMKDGSISLDLRREEGFSEEKIIEYMI